MAQFIYDKDSLISLLKLNYYGNKQHWPWQFRRQQIVWQQKQFVRKQKLWQQINIRTQLLFGQRQPQQHQLKEFIRWLFRPQRL